MIIGFLLGHMATETFFGNFEGSPAAEGFQRLTPIHVDNIFLPQVDIAFRHIPRSEFFYGTGNFFSSAASDRQCITASAQTRWAP
jgi:hypothetical protein